MLRFKVKSPQKNWNKLWLYVKCIKIESKRQMSNMMRIRVKCLYLSRQKHCNVEWRYIISILQIEKEILKYHVTSFTSWFPFHIWFTLLDKPFTLNFISLNIMNKIVSIRSYSFLGFKKRTVSELRKLGWTRNIWQRERPA